VGAGILRADECVWWQDGSILGSHLL